MDYKNSKPFLEDFQKAHDDLNELEFELLQLYKESGNDKPAIFAALLTALIETAENKAFAWDNIRESGFNGFPHDALRAKC